MPFDLRDNFFLLSGHPLIQTNEREQMMETLQKTYDIKGIAIAKTESSFLGIINRVDLEHISLQFCVYNAESSIQFLPTDNYRQFICFRGLGDINFKGKHIIISPESTCIIPQNCEFTAKYSGDYAHLVISINPQSLVRHARNMPERDSHHPIMLPTLEALDVSKLNRFKAIALCLAYQFSIHQHSNNPAIQALEQALLSSFIFEHQHNFVDLLKIQSSLMENWHIRAVEDYLKANWNKNINLNDIANFTGIATRSIFLSFKRHREYSPMEFLRDVRLTHARDMLMAQEQKPSVTRIALDCCFNSLGHFAKHYREKFGELPSETMTMAVHRQKEP